MSSLAPLPILSADNSLGARWSPSTSCNSSLTQCTAYRIERLLYTHSLVLFPGSKMTPKGQYELTQRFDPDAKGEYGHGSVGEYIA